MEPKWLHRYWRAEFFPGLSSQFLDAFGSSALNVTSPLSQSVIFHLAGAINDHQDDDGAVGNRDARYTGGFNTTWPPGAAAARSRGLLPGWRPEVSTISVSSIPAGIASGR